jgi:hypothetical protein
MANNNEARDREEAITNAADALADYLWPYNQGMVLTTDTIWGELWDATFDRISALRKNPPTSGHWKSRPNAWG